MPYTPEQVVQLFLLSVEDRNHPYIDPKTYEVSYCRIFVGWRNYKGCGRLDIGTRKPYVHRMALEIKLGRKLEVHEVAMHRCDNRACCNAEHLQVGTLLDNVKDMDAQGRAQRTGRKRKLTAEAALFIKTHKDHGSWNLAYMFNCSDQTIRDVWNGYTWKHVQPKQPRPDKLYNPLTDE